MLVIMKLRLSLGIQDLAYRFGISAATVSRTIVKWLVVLDMRIGTLCLIWPDRESAKNDAIMFSRDVWEEGCSYY
jgi:hypothetical protein